MEKEIIQIEFLKYLIKQALFYGDKTMALRYALLLQEKQIEYGIQ